MILPVLKYASGGQPWFLPMVHSKPRRGQNHSEKMMTGRTVMLQNMLSGEEGQT